MKRNRWVMMNADGDGEGGNGGSGGAPGGSPGGGSEGAPSVWYGGFDNAELRGFVENKGWKSPQDVVSGYRDLERLQGVPKDFLLKLPQKDDDAEGWGQVWSRLGRPENEAGYGLDKVEGADPDFAKMMAKAFYESGMPKRAADRVMQDYASYAKSYFEKQSESGKLAAQADETKLRSEWGDQYQATVERGGAALKELWGDKADAAMEALQAKLGVYETGKLVARLADRAGEANFRTNGEGTGGNTGFGMSRDGAIAQIAALKQDQSFVSDLLGDNQQRAKAARDKLTRLQMIAHPGNIEGIGVTHMGGGSR